MAQWTTPFYLFHLIPNQHKNRDRVSDNATAATANSAIFHNLLIFKFIIYSKNTAIHVA